MEDQNKMIQEILENHPEDFLRSTGYLVPITPEQIEIFDELFPDAEIPESYYEPTEYPDNILNLTQAQPQDTRFVLAARKGKNLSDDTLKKMQEDLRKAMEEENNED
jgi:hypothetical protein